MQYLQTAMDMESTMLKGYTGLLHLTLPIHNDDTFQHTRLWETFVNGSENKQIQKFAERYSEDRIQVTIDIVKSILGPFNKDIDLLLKQWMESGEPVHAAVAKTLDDSRVFRKENEIDNAFYM